MPHRTPPPHLHSLDQRASWRNTTGRVDRSTCVDLRVNDIWRSARFQAATDRTRRKYKHLIPTPKSPDLQPSTLVAVADLTLYPDHLHHAAKRLRKPLVGDYRTKRANAMKPHSPDPRFNLFSPAERPIPNQDPPPPNPNHGPHANKRLALTDNWSQSIQLQSWCESHRLDRHYLLCPTCQQRARSLYLPLCTQQEFDDAKIAYLWLHHFRARHPNAPGQPIEVQLYKRYGTLFPPRTLKCRHCLGIRYGEVKRKMKYRENN